MTEKESTELALIDPAEFGLNVKQSTSIEQAFDPAMSEAKALFKVYDLMITKEVTEEVCEEAKTARIATGKAIKKIEDIHKTQKAYFWNGGKFVDSLKNIKVEPLKQIKEGFKKIEDHFYSLELEKIEKVRIERTKELWMFTDIIPEDIGAMRPKVYGILLAGAKVVYEKKIEDEKRDKEEKVKAEKLVVLLADRKKKMLIAGFSFNGTSYIAGDINVAGDHKILEMNERDFGWFIGVGKLELEKLSDIQETQRKENEHLKKEADENKRLTKIEADKRERIEAERLEKEKKERLEREKTESDRQEIQQAILDKERKRRQEIADELQAIEYETAKKQREEQEQIEAELRKGDADKIEDLIKDLYALMVKYSFKSSKNQAKYLGVIELIAKVIRYIEK